ncbi:carboxypeptidase inhibitor SmCI-like isoform X1 [Lethenteron reissneri]|uniref:carboxypeptidase inhibitor SmCI-like isoform X1 n=1 Tax=Lethenteron reissneri TaxID=7753 RepID=UPI002AB778D5|nr:carboxypeptidase inhibitor SmCI-like isoform X1 [Lethenteron reissneri]
MKMKIFVLMCVAIAAAAASGERRVPELCLAPPEVGLCRALIPKWYYDAAASECRSFSYGGCGGNDNKFSTQLECEEQCLADAGGNNITQEARMEGPTDDTCTAPMVEGPCMAAFLRWFYDAESRACREFTYGGCHGNKNNFESSAECMKACSTDRAVKSQRMPIQFEQPLQGVCTAPPFVGPCRASLRRWFYSPDDATCKEFIYGGCHANGNNFESKQDCAAVCSAPAGENQPHEERQNDLFVHVLGVLVAVLASLMVLVLLFLWMQRLRQRQTHLPEVFTVVRPNNPKQDDTEYLIPNIAS